MELCNTCIKASTTFTLILSFTLSLIHSLASQKDQKQRCICIYQTNRKYASACYLKREKQKVKIKRENKQHENEFSAHKTWFAINWIVCI